MVTLYSKSACLNYQRFNSTRSMFLDANRVGGKKSEKWYGRCKQVYFSICHILQFNLHCICINVTFKSPDTNVFNWTHQKRVPWAFLTQQNGEEHRTMFTVWCSRRFTGKTSNFLKKKGENVKKRCSFLLNTNAY